MYSAKIHDEAGRRVSASFRVFSVFIESLNAAGRRQEVKSLVKRENKRFCAAALVACTAKSTKTRFSAKHVSAPSNQLFSSGVKCSVVVEMATTETKPLSRAESKTVRQRKH